MKYDLKNITYMLNKLQNPHNKFQSIHIAGTNGKGATSSFIASILMEHGLRVGLFTSPHILKFNERIRVNGKCISNKYIIEFLEYNKNVIRKIKPSFFEVNTAMAFQYFADKNVDIAVIECGLGGRLDSTNVIKPMLSVITQIGMDHMKYLGNTMKKIALEKIGIVKPGVDVIVSDKNLSLKKIFKTKINENNLFYLDDRIKIHNLANRKFAVLTSGSEGFMFTIPLPGDFQARNAVSAIIAGRKYLQQTGIEPDEKKIKKGLKNVKINTGYRCRLETIRIKNKEFIFDISHNPDGLKETCNVLKKTKIDAVIFGMMDDKDYSKAIASLLKLSKNIIFTKAFYKRAASPKILHNIAKKYCSKNHNLVVKENIKDSVKYIIDENRKMKRVLITGSFFIVGDAVKALQIQKLFK